MCKMGRLSVHKENNPAGREAVQEVAVNVRRGMTCVRLERSLVFWMVQRVSAALVVGCPDKN